MKRWLSTQAPEQTVPAPAAAVGFNLRTLGPLITIGGSTPNWYSYNFLGNTEPSGSITTNADGTVTLSGNSGNTYNANICTAHQDGTSPSLWRGLAIGGGAFVEVEGKFNPSGVQSGVGFPALPWDMCVAHLSGNGLDTSPGNAGYKEWIERDGGEWVASSLQQYKRTLFDHYFDGTTIFNPNTTAFVPIGSSAFGIYNRYGYLYVTATPTKQGYFQAYFNRKPVGAPVVWNQLASPNTIPPVAGSNMGALGDIRPAAIIIGTSSTSWPLTVKRASVWQASGANNLIY